MRPRVWNKHRDKGKIPPGAIYVGRPSKWGNPFPIGPIKCGHPDCGPGAHGVITREMAIAQYRNWLAGMLKADPEFLAPLRGKDLVCWCSPKPCHADVIMEMATGDGPGGDRQC